MLITPKLTEKTCHWRHAHALYCSVVYFFLLPTFKAHATQLYGQNKQKATPKMISVFCFPIKSQIINRHSSVPFSWLVWLVTLRPFFIRWNQGISLSSCSAQLSLITGVFGFEDSSLSLHQWSPKCGPRAAAAASHGNLSWMQILGPHSAYWIRTLGWGPANSFSGPPHDSCTRAESRTPGLVCEHNLHKTCLYSLQRELKFCWVYFFFFLPFFQSFLNKHRSLIYGTLIYHCGVTWV